MATLKTINQIDEYSKFNTILRPKGLTKSPIKPTSEIDVLGFDMEWDSATNNVISSQLAWFDEKGEVKSRVFYVGLNAEFLLRLVEGCLGRPTSNVVLVSHFATAEIGHIANALKEFSIREFNKAVEASVEFDFETTEDPLEMRGGISGLAEFNRPKGKVRLKIADLMGFMSMSLEKIGKTLGVKKVNLSKVERGNPDSYWKEHMLELLQKHRSKFEEYAKKDAEITLKAYDRLRDYFSSNHNLNLTNFHTASSIGIEVFKREYLHEPVVPFYEFGEQYSRWDKKTHEWKIGTRNKLVLQYDRYQPRLYSMLSYWGGRSEAYGRGLLKKDLTLYDVDSLYPSSAALQPLPNRDTEWVPFHSYREARALEGFACVSFQFPDECFYPCIPVVGFKSGKLYFPSSGEHCWCTIAELREARRLRAKFTEVYGLGFRPKKQERDHPLKHYANHFMTLKRKSEKGSYEYQLYKLMLNGPIGKFWETEKDNLVTAVLAKYREGALKFGYQGFYDVWKRMWSTRPRRTGSSWWPEAIALIVGKARALMSQFIEKGALFTSTDSVLLPSKTTIKCDARDQLVSVGSDLKEEGEASKAWILRTKCYVLWKPDGKLLRVARHGFNIPKTDDTPFANAVTKAIEENSPTPLQEFTRANIVKVKQAIREAMPLATDVTKTTHPTTNWDGKRVLNGPDNLFREFRMLPPQLCMPEIVSNPGRQPGARPKAEGIAPSG